MDAMDQLLDKAINLLSLIQLLVVIMVILGFAKMIDWIIDKFY